MGKAPLTLIDQEIERIQNIIIDAAVDEITANLDSLPVVGMGMKFMQRSAEGVIRRRIKTEVRPDLEEHTAAHIAYINDLVGADDPEAVHEEHAEELLATNPIWTMIDDAVRDEVQEKVLSHSRESAVLIAGWVEEAEGETFEDFVALAAFLDIGADGIEDVIHDLLFYIDLLEEYREHLDPGAYSSTLGKEEVRTWFLDHLIAGLKEGREEAVTFAVGAMEDGEAP